MHQSFFFKLFPPPKFILMPYAGIDISDDSLSFIEYSRPVGNRHIIKYGTVKLESGIIVGGDVKDETKLLTALKDFVRINEITDAKLSIPEEKAYLFETEIPYADLRTISQNIEFKLEENIPLSAPDAVFAFDILPGEHGKPLRASVSAVPRTYIEHMMALLSKAGVTTVSFETVPRAIARIVSANTTGDTIVVHSMKSKTGIYVVSENTVGFTSTISIGKDEADMNVYTDKIASEISRVQNYWASKNENIGDLIKQVVVVGYEAESVNVSLGQKISEFMPVKVVDVWYAILDKKGYVPPISMTNSFEYISAAGLAI